MALALAGGAGNDGWVDVDQNLQHSKDVADKLTTFFRPRSVPNVQGGRDYETIDHPLLHQFYSHTEKPLPRAISDRFDEVECRLDMGFFPEIRHAWVTVDCRLYLWDYNDDSNHFFPYDRLDQVILSVALVKPPEDRHFTREVEYLLAVATLTEIVLLAVVFDADRRVRLRPTDYSLATDETSIVRMEGLNSRGRLFMAAIDGNLYELEYNEENSLYNHVFGANKCRKKNHSSRPLSVFVPSFLRIPGLSAEAAPLEHLVVDQERNLLYTLSSGLEPNPCPQLTVYDLGQDGSMCTPAPPIPINPEGGGNVVSLTVVPRRDAEDPSLRRGATRTADLVIVMESGKRRFVSSGVNMQSAHRSRPHLANVMFKEKRGPEPLVPAQGPANVILAAFWSYDVALFASGPHDGGVAEQDFPLFATCRDPPLDRKLDFPKEVVQEFPVGSEVFAIAEDDPERTLRAPHIRGKQPLPLSLPLDELAAQYRLLRQREFVCLAGAVSVGQEPRLLRYAKRRPIDQLKKILLSHYPGQAGILEDFQTKYCNPDQDQADQFCCMCLDLACAPPSADAGEWGAGESAKAVEKALEYGKRCDSKRQHHLGGGSAGMIDGGCFVDGLWLYIARLTEQFWASGLCENASGPMAPRRWSRSPDQWRSFREPLERLLQLLGENTRLQEKVENGRRQVNTAEQPVHGAGGAGQQDIIKHASLIGNVNWEEVFLFKACKFLQRVTEGLWLLEILGEHGETDGNGHVIRDVCAQVEAENSNAHRKWWFSTMATHPSFDGSDGYPRKMSEKALSNAGEDSAGRARQVRLAQRLYRHCPSFFPVGDELVVIGDQAFTHADMEPDPAIRESLFQDALDKYQQAAGYWNSHLDVQKHLQKACDKFISKSREGQALELALACASRYEEQWYGGQVGCFDQCRDICHQIIENQIFRPLLKMSPQAPWSAVLTQVLDRALESKDAHFHHLLYRLMWQHTFDGAHPARTLLEGFSTPYIEQFLAQQNEQVHYYHYLLHVREKPDLAARVMFKFAMRPSPSEEPIELAERLDWLNKAIGSAQMCGTVSLSGRRAGSAFPDDELHNYKSKRIIVKLQIEVTKALSDALVGKTLSDHKEARAKVWKAGLKYEVVEKLDDLNEICVKLEFWPLVLQILANASVSNAVLEQHAIYYWKKIMDEETNFPALKEKMKSLGDRHAGHDGIFPTKELCRALNEKAWSRRDEPGGVGHTWVVGAIVQIETDKLPRQTMYNHIYDAFYGFLQDPEPSVDIRERLKREIWTMGALAEIFVCCKNESERGEDAQFLEQSFLSRHLHDFITKLDTMGLHGPNLDATDQSNVTYLRKVFARSLQNL